MTQRAFYVTTPIYYISGTPHIGHAYTTIAADILARTARAWDGDARSLTGTDEHGQKVAQAAEAAGKTPQAYVDELAPKWKALAPAFDAQFSDFIRTTEPRHRIACLALFEKMRANGDVYEGTYEGWYCTNDETFWPEAKLIDGRCPNPECRREVQWLSEKNWFFKLSAYTDRLIAHFKAKPEFLRPQSVYNEMMRTLEGGLDDLSISRSTIDWGIPLPGGGVLYVWFDALINYISALGYPHDSALMARYWPGVHLIGKEIARFHTLIWPAMLWSAGLGRADARVRARLAAHRRREDVEEPRQRRRSVQPRSTNSAPTRCAIFSFAKRRSAATSRSRSKSCGCATTPISATISATCCAARSRCSRNTATGSCPQPRESQLGDRFADIGAQVHEHVMALRFREALDTIWELITALNREIDDRKPWDLYKHERGVELDALLYDLCEGLRFTAILLFPFMPSKATEMWQQLGLAGTPDVPWQDELRWGALAANTQTNPGDALFPRLEPPAA